MGVCGCRVVGYWVSRASELRYWMLESFKRRDGKSVPRISKCRVSLLDSLGLLKLASFALFSGGYDPLQWRLEEANEM
jgi:hypothetical protein